jgi:hypothetical protein
VYVVAVRQLADHYGKSTDQISEEELRQYFLYLSQVRKVFPSTFKIALSAIKFFFEYTLRRQSAILELVRPTREKKLPMQVMGLTPHPCKGSCVSGESWPRSYWAIRTPAPIMLAVIPLWLRVFGSSVIVLEALNYLSRSCALLLFHLIAL